MERGRVRVPLAVAAAVVVAEVAVVLLRPRGGVVDPAPVQDTSYFSPAELARARRFGRGQLALYGARTAVELAVLARLVRRPPRVLRGAHGQPLIAAAATGGALSVGLTAATLPVSAVSRKRAIDVGLATQSWSGWAGDVAKATAIGGAFAAGGSVVALGLMRRFPERWWAPASAAGVAVGAAFMFAGPVVLDPIFNRFTPLDGEAREDVVALARRADLEVGGVYEVDASRRTTAANAYVTGLGRTKRVVMYDTLLEAFTPEERRLVVAHELAHVHHRDVPRGLLYLALVAPFGLRAVARMTDVLTGRRAGERPEARAVPALALAASAIAPPLTAIANQLSRRVEARADTYALRLTDAPQALIEFERRITLQNVGDPDPPRWVHRLLGSHPTTVERIGVGLAWARGARA